MSIKIPSRWRKLPGPVSPCTSTSTSTTVAVVVGDLGVNQT